jgi:hypothetical protein
MHPNLLAALAAIVVLIFIVDLLRRGVLREKYAVLWIFVSGVAILFALVPSTLEWLTQTAGVSYQSNMVFFLTIVLLVLVSVHLSYELSRHEARIRRLAEEVALLDEEMERLRGRLDAQFPDSE